MKNIDARNIDIIDQWNSSIYQIGKDHFGTEVTIGALYRSCDNHGNRLLYQFMTVEWFARYWIFRYNVNKQNKPSDWSVHRVPQCH